MVFTVEQMKGATVDCWRVSLLFTEPMICPEVIAVESCYCFFTV